MSFINKINKYLLEQYPLIWNTRLLWMILVNIAVHLLFFVIGFCTVSGLEDLKEYSRLNKYFFETSNVYYNILISIFILLIWIIFYLRNNAFKNLYSIKKGMLFQQFFIVLLIIFISTTQFYSFKKGLTLKIKSLYSWQEVDKDIKTFNRTSLFLMQNDDDYKIAKKKYPAPFPLKVAMSYKHNLSKKIDTTKAFLKYKNRFLQFYKFDKTSEPEDKNEYAPIYANHDFKNRIVKDISEFKVFLQPSLLNYSKELFGNGQDSLDYKKQLNYFEKTLNSKDDALIKEALINILALADKYKVKHNLDLETWFKLVNNKPNYLLTKLINTSNPLLDDLNKVKYNKNSVSKNGGISYSKTLFFNVNATDNFFNNVYKAYFPDLEIEFFYFLLVFSIILSILLFIFKTTSMRTLLLSFVASLVVLVLIVWLMSSSKDLFINSQYTEYFIMLFISFVIILLSIISYVLRWNKIIISIFWSLVLFAAPTFFLFAGLSYSKYLIQIYLELNPKKYSYKSGFEIWFDSYGFWSIILIWIFTIYIYAFYIRKLKARVA
jgi:hypothetical protein